MIPVRYIGGGLPNRWRAKRRDLRALAGMVIHRFGGWPRGVWSYPGTQREAIMRKVPWRPALVGRQYEETPHGINRFALEVEGWSRHPYTFQIYKGRIYQTAPLDVITPHAGDFNGTHVGIVVTGDHRHRAPPAEDLEAAAALAGDLCLLKGWQPAEVVTLDGENVPRVLGHDELPSGATATPGKRCPGAGLKMDDFRPMAAERRRRYELDHHQGPGLILTS